MGLFSQSIQLLDTLGNNVNGQTIIYASHVLDDDNKVDFNMKNVGASAITIKVKRYELNTVPGTANYFCFYQCLSPFNSGVYPFREVVGGINFNAGEVKAKYLNAHHQPLDNPGLAKFRYVAYNAADPNDSAFVDIHFDMTVSINEASISQTKLNVFPNPASKRISLEYSLANFTSNDSYSFVLRNMLGATVKQFNMTDNSGKENINIENLQPGIYFYSLMVNDQVVTSKRLIVK